MIVLEKVYYEHTLADITEDLYEELNKLVPPDEIMSGKFIVQVVWKEGEDK